MLPITDARYYYYAISETKANKAISDLSEIHGTNLSVYFLRGIHDHAHIILQGDTGLIREALYLKSIMF